MTMGTRGGVPAEDAMTAFSALHLLRNYHQLFAPTGSGFMGGCDLNHVHREDGVLGEWPPLLGAFQPYLPATATQTTPLLSEAKGRVLLTTTRRPRGEKKPIPDDQKDDRYYERRKRNNQAAKKSRDARKLREDQIALRAAILEHENAVLRAQILTLREETQSLRQLLFAQGKAPIKAPDEAFRLIGTSDYCERSVSAEETE